MELKITRKFNGVKIAAVFAIIAFLAGLNQLKDSHGIREAELSFLEAGIIIIGIALYFLGKRRVLEEPFRHSKIIETILFVTIVSFLILSILSGSWYENPLIFSVTPIWILLAYGYLHIAKIKE